MRKIVLRLHNNICSVTYLSAEYMEKTAGVGIIGWKGLSLPPLLDHFFLSFFAFVYR